MRLSPLFPCETVTEAWNNAFNIPQHADLSSFVVTDAIDKSEQFKWVDQGCYLEIPSFVVDSETLAELRLICFAGQLSVGEMQRLACARLILTKPKLAFMDEPFSALGTSLAINLLEVLKNLGTALVVTSQPVSPLSAHFDRKIKLNKGGSWTTLQWWAFDHLGSYLSSLKTYTGSGARRQAHCIF